MTPLPNFQANAHDIASRLPPLLARAERLANAVLPGSHGRRRSGAGDDFWQYRPAQTGDARGAIDFRRSARGDTQFVKEREWQISQSVMLWIDGGASMRFASADGLPQKIDQARVLGLALAILLLRAGERVGLLGENRPARRGTAQIPMIAEALCHTTGYVPEQAMMPASVALFASDFLGDIGPVERALARSADQGVRGVLYQILDPAEEVFPYRGRTVFQSMSGTVEHETLQAAALRERYLERLATRKALLAKMAAAAGWRYEMHRTDSSAQVALLWLYRALEGRGGI